MEYMLLDEGDYHWKLNYTLKTLKLIQDNQTNIN